ncbi:MAG: 2-dehydropantoate 2-reductase [Gemmatimonadota bacterium]
MNNSGHGGPAPIVVWGAGAMGGCIGASLVREGTEVLFVDRAEDHVRAMNQAGLQITGPVEEFSVRVRAAIPPEVKGRFPLCLLCVKSHDTNDALDQLAPHLADDGAVVSIQNGLCEHEIADRVGPERTIGAFVNFGADYLEPGVIYRGNRGATVVGELDGTLTDRIGRIHRLLQTFEPNAVLTDNIFGYLWGKLAYASLLFASALTNDSIADVLAEESFRPTLMALAQEAVAVALAQGVELESFDGFDPEAFRPGGELGRAASTLDDLVGFNRASGKTHSGIWRDLAVRKRRTEVDAQLGWIVRLGARKGVPTPLTQGVIQQIHEIESGARALDRENMRELG